MAGATGDVDDAARPVLALHLPVDPDREPQRADQVHLNGERVEQHRAFEVVVGGGRPLDARDQGGDILGMR